MFELHYSVDWSILNDDDDDDVTAHILQFANTSVDDVRDDRNSEIFFNPIPSHSQ